ncbi:hypothetical protein B9M45_22995 [Salmonella enterica]|nr:hypothetical protein [Salmonella enterica]EDX8740292.1 hypothetical protein [Salmonella enterica subsp. enterica serovar Galiema]
MSSASITLLNGSPFHSPVTRKCIYHLHKTKLAVASSDKRNPRECEDCYFCGAESRAAALQHLWTLPISKQAPRRALVLSFSIR